MGARVAALFAAPASRRVLWFALGAGAVLAVAVSPPVDYSADRWLTAHMVQHLLLTLVAAPLLAVALGAWRPRRRAGILAGVLTHPVAAWGISTLVLWGWHAPAAYDAALADDRVHVAEHLSFVAAYVLYWWPLLGPGGAERSNAFRAFYLLAGAMAGGLLGALLTFAPDAWYAHYAATPGATGLSPLADQHLAGAVMWLLGAVPFALVGVLLLGEER